MVALSRQMTPCAHPAANLKPEQATVANDAAVTVSFTCSACLVRLTKSFLGRTPEPAENPGHIPGSKPVSEMAQMTSPGISHAAGKR
jgi:3-mercaptopyruvate sulfurtransferase SseA